MATVAARRLGKELLLLREAAGLTQEDVEIQTHGDVKASSVSRWESGSRTIQPWALRLLLSIYQASDRFDELAAIRAKAKQIGWWDEYREGVPDWFSGYVRLEAEASTVRAFNVSLVPGLLQTEAYHRAVMETAPDVSADEIAQRVAVRRIRQARLTSDTPLGCWMIIAQAAIETVRALSPELADDQFKRLLDATELPNVNLQVLPFSAGLHPGLDGAFSIISFPTDPDVAYLEQAASSLYVESPTGVSRYGRIFEHLMALSLDQRASRRMIEAAADGQTGG